MRRMMVAVAVVALLLDFGRMRERYEGLRDSYEARGVMHAAHEVLERDGGADVFMGFGLVKPNAMRAAYHARMRRKYERAARYPWLPVEPDPPEPR
jgi:hypothetical protein